MTDTLIARLESAVGPDRELDAMIQYRITSGVGCGAAQDAPRYTASIDAALTLVPEGWRWAVTSKNSACCHEHHVGPLDWSYASTPALALATAALKARGV